MLQNKLVNFTILLSISTTSLFSDIDMMNDIFDLDLQTLQNIKVSSASKMKQSVSDAPANMKIINKDQIAKRGYRNLKDLLEDIPGFNVMNFANPGLNSFIGVRGIMGSNYFKILRDGIEIDATQTDKVSVGMNYPLFGIKRVEILYGGASVIYGSDAVSGVINLVSDTTVGTSAQISLGTDGYYYGDLKYTTKLNQNTFTIQAHNHQDQEYDFTKYYPQDFISSDENKEFSYMPSKTKSLFALLKSENWELGANYSNTVDSTLLGINGSVSKYYLYDDNANLDYEMMGVYFKHKLKTSINTQITSTLSFDSTELDINSYFINSNTNYEPAYKYAFSQRTTLEEIFTYTTQNNALLIGTSIESFKATPISSDLERPYLDPYATYSGTDIPVDYFSSEWINYGIFLQDQYQLTKEWQVSVAARYNINEQYKNSFTPRVALIYKLSPRTTHKLIYSASFLAPSVDNKYKHYGYSFEPNDGSRSGDTNTYQSAGSARIVNGELAPEESQNFEYNIVSWFSKNLLLESSLYYNIIKNKIGDARLTNVTDILDDVTFTRAKQRFNNAEFVSYGGDISFIYNHNFSHINFDSWFNYAYLDGHESVNGVKSELSYKKTHTLNLGATFSYKKFDVTPSLKYVRDINSGAEDKENPTEKLKAPNYSVTDLFIRYSYSEKISLLLNIHNLFDKRYYDVREGSSTSSYLTPQAARLSIASIKIKF